MKHHLPILGTLSILSFSSCMEDSPRDTALRSFLDVNSITASFTIPPNKEYTVTTLHFLDGKLESQVAMTIGKKVSRGRKVDVDFLWDDETATLCSGDGSVKIFNPLWQKAKDGVVNFNGDFPQYGGFTILGFSHSFMEYSPEKISESSYSDFKKALSEKKYVCAVAVAFFDEEGGWDGIQELMDPLMKEDSKKTAITE